MTIESTLKDWEQLCYNHVHNDVKHLVELLEKQNVKSINLLDIGANVGCMYDSTAAHVKIKKAYLVEPAVKLYEFMRNKYKDDQKVKLYNFCISNNTGPISFYTPDFSLIDNSRLYEYGLGRFILHGGPEERPNMSMIQSYALDDAFKKFKWPDIDVVKIDTENMDFQILSGMHKFVHAQKKLPIIIFENNWDGSLPKEEADTILNWYKEFYDFSMYEQGIFMIFPLQ